MRKRELLLFADNVWCIYCPFVKEHSTLRRHLPRIIKHSCMNLVENKT